MLAMVSFPEVEYPLFCNGWYHLKGWFNPPEFVTQFWASACYIEFSDKEDYEYKKNLVQTLYVESVRSYYSMMAL